MSKQRKLEIKSSILPGQIDVFEEMEDGDYE